MKRALAVALVLLAALSCERKSNAVTPAAVSQAAAAKSPSAPNDPNENANLLNFAHGASVVSRTAESNLLSSALMAIDGNLATAWGVPHGDFPQSAVFALAARSRIERVGVSAQKTPGFDLRKISFESSLDGVTFQPLGTFAIERKDPAQLFPVTPADATFIRATLLEGGADTRVNAIFALGREIEAPRLASLDGCWTVNGLDAQFTQRGAHAYGRVAIEKMTTSVEGGSDGRFFRFAWLRGAGFGYAAVSVAPDGKTFSGSEWNEEIIPLFYSGTWFGERRACTPASLPSGEVTRGLLQRFGRAPLYGLRFDANGNLLDADSVDTLATLRSFLLGTKLQARLVAHEFRQGSEQRNRAFANAELASIERSLTANGVPAGRLSFVAAGSDAPREIPVTEAMRALYSSVDLEIRR